MTTRGIGGGGGMSAGCGPSGGSATSAGAGSWSGASGIFGTSGSSTVTGGSTAGGPITSCPTCLTLAAGRRGAQPGSSANAGRAAPSPVIRVTSTRARMLIVGSEARDSVIRTIGKVGRWT